MQKKAQEATTEWATEANRVEGNKKKRGKRGDLKAKKGKTKEQKARGGNRRQKKRQMQIKKLQKPTKANRGPHKET